MPIAMPAIAPPERDLEEGEGEGEGEGESEGESVDVPSSPGLGFKFWLESYD